VWVFWQGAGFVEVLGMEVINGFELVDFGCLFQSEEIPPAPFDKVL
jgi:hypothetical protein